MSFSKLAKIEEDNRPVNIVRPYAFSKECMSNTLNLHDTYPTQVAIRRTRTEELNPVNSIQNSTYAQFRITSHGSEVIDPFNTFLKVELKVQRKDGAALKEDDVALLVNNPPSSMWKSVRADMNGTNVQEADGLYPYRANVEKSLMATTQAQYGSYCLAGFVPERVKFDSLKLKKDELEEKSDEAKKAAGKPDKNAKPFIQRCELTRKNATLLYIDSIHADIFRQDKKLPPGTELTLWFDRHDNTDFIIKTFKNEENPYKLVLNKAVLLVRYCLLDDGVVNEMMTMLQKIPYQIPIRRVEMNYFSKASGISDYSEPNALVKEGNFVPRRIFFFAIEQDAFHGDTKKDPFFYKNLKPNMISLRLGGQTRPYPEIQMNRKEINCDYSEPLFYLYQAVGTCFSNDAQIPIHLEDMDTGNFIIGFDLTSVDADNAFELAEKTTVELKYKLSEAPNEPHILLVYMEYDSEIQINSEGQVQILKN